MSPHPSSVQILLEAAALHPAPLEWIVPVFDQQALNIVLPFGLETNIEQAVSIAYHQGLITLAKSTRALNEWKIADIAWPVEDVSMVDVRLTKKGARHWEANAQPRWTDFIRCSASGENRLELLASSTAVLEEWLEFAPALRRIRATEGTLLWSDISPWHATYWKTLDHGKKLCLEYTKVPTMPFCPDERALRWKWAKQNWYISFGRRLSWEDFRTAFFRTA